METNRQYELMAEAAGKKIRERDPELLAEMTGFRWDGERLSAKSLGMDIAVSRSDWSVTPRLDPWHALTILQYLANTKGVVPMGNFISISEFRSGGLARGTSFDRENDRVIGRIGAFSAETIRKAAKRLGGWETEERSDLTFLFSFLPHVPVKLNLWLPDEDFPASGKVLFDVSVESDLQVEAAGTAAGIMLTLLERAAMEV